MSLKSPSSIRGPESLSPLLSRAAILLALTACDAKSETDFPGSQSQVAQAEVNMLADFDRSQLERQTALNSSRVEAKSTLLNPSEPLRSNDVLPQLDESEDKPAPVAPVVQNQEVAPLNIPPAQIAISPNFNSGPLENDIEAVLAKMHAGEPFNKLDIVVIDANYKDCLEAQFTSKNKLKPEKVHKRRNKKSEESIDNQCDRQQEAFLKHRLSFVVSKKNSGQKFDFLDINAIETTLDRCLKKVPFPEGEEPDSEKQKSKYQRWATQHGLAKLNEIACKESYNEMIIYHQSNK